ncbi:MAG: SNF2-related protein, partial [Limisphaerales bacterium]
MPSSWKFYPGQLDYLSRVATKPYALVAAGTGCGKSLMAIALLRLALDRVFNTLDGSTTSARALILAPQGTVNSDTDPADHGGAEPEEDMLSQWETELATFAPGIPVHRLFSWEDYERLVRRYGVLPPGIYLSYYEAFFKNGGREFLPETWDANRLADVFSYDRRTFDPLMKDPAYTPESKGDPYLDIARTVGWERNGIRCVAEPCLSTRIEAAHTQLTRRSTLARHPLWDLVALDEAHVIANLGSQITQSVIRLQATRRYALTATPIPNIVSNLFSVMGWLCVEDWHRGDRHNAAWPYTRGEIGRFTETFLSIERDYTAEDNKRKANPRWRGKCTKISPVLSSPARLLKLLKPSMAYVSKEMCNPDVVPCRVIDVRVPMGADQQKLYDWASDRSNVPAGKLPMVRASRQLTWLRGICADPKGFSKESTPAAGGKPAPRCWSNFNPKTQAALELIHQCLDRGEQVTVISARVGQTDELYFRIVNAIGAD